MLLSATFIIIFIDRPKTGPNSLEDTMFNNLDLIITK